MNLPTPLPIDSLLSEIVATMGSHSNLVLLAPPGAGKTTRVPPALLDASWLAPPNHRILMLQPRRIATRAAAQRIAGEQGWIPGREVGWQVRFENKTTDATRIHVMTEGILARRILSDPFLEGVGCVILDEFHERNIHSDVALALLREIQTTVREDLRLVVMSATLDPQPISSFLGNAPILRSDGRMFPVDIQYLSRPSTRPCWELAAEAVRHHLETDPEGDFLVFLPGMGEIRRTARLLEDLDVELPILHSSVSSEQQDRALKPASRRKIVLATNIAETSLTIEGVRTVVDTGLARILVNDPRHGLDRLDLRRISINSARQRAGRAGRTGPGVCYRLWAAVEENSMEQSETPEIHRMDLAGTILLLKQYGVTDIHRFAWFEAPQASALNRAMELLRLLGAIDGAGVLTKSGRQLAQIPAHPRLGVLLQSGANAGYGKEAALLAALLSERDVFASREMESRGGTVTTECDLLLRLDLLEEHGAHLDPAAVRTVRRLAGDMERFVHTKSSPKSPRPDRSVSLRRALLAAFPDRVAMRREDGSPRGLMVGGRGVTLDRESGVRGGRFFLAMDLRDPPGGGGEATVRMASLIEPSWLADIHPNLVGERPSHQVDPESGRVQSRRQATYMDLVWKESPMAPGDDPAGVSRALFEYLAPNVEDLVLSDKATANLVARIRFLSKALPGEGWPVYNRDQLLKILEQACQGCRSVSEVSGKALHEALLTTLDWSLRRSLEELAPETLSVPSGSNIRLKYGEPGADAPILAARLQELFGLKDTPRIAGGRVPVLLHLLGPNYRPVQVTTDLASFWNTTYFEVRKELRARYPRHPWPEDPWNAPPVAVGRRRR